MTTGTRLKSKSSGWVALVFSTTLWFALGNFCGWYIGSSAGFRRGVSLTANLVINLMTAKEDAESYVSSPHKYTDL